MRKVDNGCLVREESDSGPDETSLLSRCLIFLVDLLGICSLRLTLYAPVLMQTGL